MSWNCKKCGGCCQYVIIKIMANDEMVEHMEARYGEKLGTSNNKNLLKISIPHRCKQLTEDNLCRIHDNKPEICKSFRCKPTD